MKERNKPTKSFIARSIEEIEKEAFKKGCEAGRHAMIERLRELQSGYENDLDAEPRVYERDIQLCAKISLLERLINELED